jgi:hypothetical protein
MEGVVADVTSRVQLVITAARPKPGRLGVPCFGLGFESEAPEHTLQPDPYRSISPVSSQLQVKSFLCVFCQIPNSQLTSIDSEFS